MRSGPMADSRMNQGMKGGQMQGQGMMAMMKDPQILV